MDAMFAWALGFLSGMSDMIQALDMEHCKLPTIGGGRLFTCPCDDKPLAIPNLRRYFPATKCNTDRRERRQLTPHLKTDRIASGGVRDR